MRGRDVLLNAGFSNRRSNKTRAQRTSEPAPVWSKHHLVRILYPSFRQRTRKSPKDAMQTPMTTETCAS